MPEMVLPARDEAAEGAPALEVDLEDADLCPRYCAQVFDVTIGPSPDWLHDRRRQ